MAVAIRLSRGGAKKRPYYRIVVADSRSARDGKYLEQIGTYNPMLPKDGERVKIDMEKAKAWLAKGAKPTDRVGRFLNQLEADAWAWEHGNNPKKGEPGEKAKEREAERLEKEEAKKAAEAEAKAAAEAPAEEPAAEAEEAPAEEAAAEEEKSE